MLNFILMSHPKFHVFITETEKHLPLVCDILWKDATGSVLEVDGIEVHPLVFHSMTCNKTNERVYNLL